MCPAPPPASGVWKVLCALETSQRVPLESNAESTAEEVFDVGRGQLFERACCKRFDIDDVNARHHTPTPYYLTAQHHRESPTFSLVVNSLHFQTPNMSKLITVFGATGNQGGSVIKAILEDAQLSKEYQIRGITRDTSKKSAQDLAKQGVEVVSVCFLSADKFNRLQLNN